MRNSRFFFLVSCVALSNHVFASSDNFSDDAAYANTSLSNSQQSISTFSPSRFQQFTSNPSETKYYQNGKSDNAIKNDTSPAFTQNDTAQNIKNNVGKQEAFSVNPNAPEIIRSNTMQQDAYNITHGISDQMIQCVPKASACTTTFTQKICDSSKPTPMQCTSTTVVTINNVPYQTEVTYTGNITPTDPYHGTFQLPEGGIVQSLSITMKSSNIWRCHNNYQGYINDHYISTYYPSCGNKLGDLSFSSNQLSISLLANTNVNFQIKGGAAFSNWQSAHYSATLLVTRYKAVPTITIKNSCTNISSICALTKSICTEPGGNRVFNGVSVYQPCWNTQNNYSCAPADDHSCDSLVSSGCSTINLHCTETYNGACVQYENTMSCPVQTCKSNDVICGEHSFCMDGNCYLSSPSQNKNFGKDEAQFAAASNSADAISQNQTTLQAFSGKSTSCSLAPIGFLNCCANKGWGKELDLASCSTKEKELGQAKQHGYAIYIGKYCSYKILGVCTEHRKGYCVFNGLLAKDIQQQGRAQQLNIGFGSAKSPDCSGISVNDLQKINFSKIDFSNLEGSLQKQANLPNQSSVKQYIAQKIQQEMNKKT